MADDDGASGTDDGEQQEQQEQQQADKGKPNTQEDTVPPEVKAALRKANKEAETLRLKLKEIEDKDKSESEKLTERVAAAEAEAAKARTEYLRLKVGAEKGLPPELASRLHGETEEDMAADAARLSSIIKPNGGGGFDAGARQNAPDGEDDMNARLRRATGRAT